jgi:CRP-like cAMP-binding protein
LPKKRVSRLPVADLARELNIEIKIFCCFDRASSLCSEPARATRHSGSTRHARPQASTPERQRTSPARGCADCAGYSKNAATRAPSRAFLFLMTSDAAGRADAVAEREMPPRGQNHFLASLSRVDRSLLESRLRSVTLTKKQVIQAAGEEVRYVYFPRSGIASILVPFSDGRTAEAALVGSNTALGLSALFGDPRSPTLITAHVAGIADRIDRADLEGCAQLSQTLTRCLRRHQQALCTHISRIAGCNAIHSAHERVCRWLLQCRDLLGADDLPVTQELLAALIGVRRAGVTLVAGELEKASLIASRRGHVRILDPIGLETEACECYLIIREHIHRLTGWLAKR